MASFDWAVGTDLASSDASNESPGMSDPCGRRPILGGAY